MAKEKVDLLIENASELVTLSGGTQRPLLGERMRDLGIIKGGSIAVRNGRIVSVAKTREIKRKFESEETIDASGKLVMPSFVDPHTHLVFAGSREDEFEMRIQGSTYMEILEKGGGILKTVNETRKASKEELLKNCRKTLDIMLRHGTTTMEAKSGYGLTTKDEIKCLEIMKLLAQEHPIDIVRTFLGAHAIPLEYKDKADEYVNLVINEMVPAVTSRRLAEFCDVFCEKGVFSVEQSRRILLSGRKHGLLPKLHADEMTRLGGAELAAEMRAVSADHLLFASDNGLRAMAKQGTVAVLLLGASFSLMMNHYADARKIIQLGVPVALGTDYNPNCWVESQQIVIALACREMKMTSAEAIVATTVNAAHAINRAQNIGTLEPNKKADVIVLDAPNQKFLGYRFGVNLVDKVIKEGKLVVDEGKVINK
ncbi:MAG: imidazolonepropionase [Candidatus Bathyarchaeota archaeon]|nr:MAG: imidazolonepropionase [Candidatus Bathyarchaeota archaeon]